LVNKLFIGSGFDDSDEEDSVKENTKARPRTNIKYDDSDEDIDDISPYDSISNAGHLKVLFI